MANEPPKFLPPNWLSSPTNSINAPTAPTPLARLAISREPSSTITFFRIRIATDINNRPREENFDPPSTLRAPMTAISSTVASIPLYSASLSNEPSSLTTLIIITSDTDSPKNPLDEKFFPPTWLIKVINSIKTPVANKPLPNACSSNAPRLVTTVWMILIAIDIEIRPFAEKFFPPTLLMIVINAINAPTARTPFRKDSPSSVPRILTAPAKMSMAAEKAIANALNVAILVEPLDPRTLSNMAITETNSPITAARAMMDVMSLSGSTKDKTTSAPTSIAIDSAIFFMLSIWNLLLKLSTASPRFSKKPPRASPRSSIVFASLLLPSKTPFIKSKGLLISSIIFLALTAIKPISPAPSKRSRFSLLKPPENTSLNFCAKATTPSMTAPPIVLVKFSIAVAKFENMVVIRCNGSESRTEVMKPVMAFRNFSRTPRTPESLLPSVRSFSNSSLVMGMSRTGPLVNRFVLSTSSSLPNIASRIESLADVSFSLKPVNSSILSMAF